MAKQALKLSANAVVDHTRFQPPIGLYGLIIAAVRPSALESHVLADKNGLAPLSVYS